jgi:hypothetical protein
MMRVMMMRVMTVEPLFHLTMGSISDRGADRAVIDVPQGLGQMAIAESLGSLLYPGRFCDIPARCVDNRGML